MKHSSTILKLAVLIISIFSTSLFAQDTLMLHYENATVSEVILDDIGTGTITGSGNDSSIGKYMLFNSALHSPVTDLISVLMDLEVSNFTSVDSFSVFVQVYNFGIKNHWEKKFAFSDIEEKSTPIQGHPVAAYNFKIDFPEGEIFNIGHLVFDIGIRYNNDTNASIALRATGEGEFSDAENRCFTINADTTISDFETQYGAEVGLAIFPITSLSGNTQELSEVGLETIYDGEKLIVNNSSNLSGKFNLSFYTVNGYLLDEKQLASGGRIEINTSAYPSGIYILNAANGDQIAISKIFIN